jgi:hypothetical protein
MDDGGLPIPVVCPHCKDQNEMRVTRWRGEALTCDSCDTVFQIDETLILQFYGCDDQAHWYLEEFYRARLVNYFMNRHLSESEAEKRQMDVFTSIWETKYPREGNKPQRYDPHYGKGGNFKKWLFQIAWRKLPRRSLPLQFPAKTTDEAEGTEVEPSPEQLPLKPDRRYPAPFDEAVLGEKQEAVRACRESLPPREKLAITVWLENEGERGTGNKLVEELKEQFPDQGVSAATAHNLIEKALTHMKECLEGKGVTFNQPG